MKPYFDFHDLSQNYINIKTAVFFLGQRAFKMDWGKAENCSVVR